jgi:hypothetical protein
MIGIGNKGAGMKVPLEKQVSSLEPSMRLVELGVEVESYFVWVDYLKQENSFVIDHSHTLNETGFEKCPAYTVAELLGMLPEGEIIIKRENGYYDADNELTKYEMPFVAETAANALSMRIEFLVANNLLTVEEINGGE